METGGAGTGLAPPPLETARRPCTCCPAALSHEAPTPVQSQPLLLLSRMRTRSPPPPTERRLTPSTPAPLARLSRRHYLPRATFRSRPRSPSESAAAPSKGERVTLRQCAARGSGPAPPPPVTHRRHAPRSSAAQDRIPARLSRLSRGPAANRRPRRTRGAGQGGGSSPGWRRGEGGKRTEKKGQGRGGI